MEILEQKFAMYILMAIKENPMSTKTDIMRLESGFEKTKFLRINELITAGLVETVKTEGYSTARLQLTPTGESVVEKLMEIRGTVSEASKRLREDFSSNYYTDIQGNVKPI